MADNPKGTKKITFDFEFEYSKGGDLDIGDTIILKAPGYSQAEVQSHMYAAVTKGVIKALPALEKLTEGQTAPEESNETASKETETLFLMALGMEDEKYTNFVNYVRKVLTNNTRLAHIEGEEIGISDMLWQEIETKGGPDAVERVLAGFIGFFTARMNAAAA